MRLPANWLKLSSSWAPSFITRAARREVVLVGEVHRAPAFLGDGDGGQRGVYLANFQRGNQAVVLLLDPLALHLHLRAQRVADVVVEAGQFAFGGLEGKRRVAASMPIRRLPSAATADPLASTPSSRPPSRFLVFSDLIMDDSRGDEGAPAARAGNRR